MSFKYTYFVAMAVLSAQPIVHAESLTSDSKYPIIVEVYKGSNGTCNAKEGDLTSKVGGIMASFESQKGNFYDKLKSGVSQAVNLAMRGSGCELIGNATTLGNKETINVPVGTTIVAYKDPFAAWQLEKKIVNPLPAVCTVQANKTITLETRKSGTMKKFLGIGGDGGLSCR
ncbi:MAG: hypothetical protein ACRYGR_00950 [Janthinobacterium lividum]